MFGTLVAVALAIVVVFGLIYVGAERRYIRAYRRVRRDLLSDDERMALLDHPGSLIRTLPSDSGRRLNVLLTPQKDRQLERLRRQALLALGIASLAVLGSLPVGLVVAKALPTLDGSRSLVDSAFLVIPIGVALYCIWIAIGRRHDTSTIGFRLSILGAIGGFLALLVRLYEHPL